MPDFCHSEQREESGNVIFICEMLYSWLEIIALICYTEQKE